MAARSAKGPRSRRVCKLPSDRRNATRCHILSIIVPALDEEAEIGATLLALSPFRARGAEVIVADGGSRDRTTALAQPLADCVIAAPRGRASQMNAGAAIARGKIFVFLHADTRLPVQADRLVQEGLAQGKRWGRFDVRIAGIHPMLPLVASMMNIRSRLTGIATGDQAMFMTRLAYDAVGGFPDLALMEDIAMSARLKQLGPPLCLREKAVTCGRRWEARGVVSTIVSMWRIRLAYRFGASSQDLARRYGYVPREG